MNKKHMPLYIYNYSTMHYQNIIKQDISEKLLKGFYLVYVIKYEKKSHKRSENVFSPLTLKMHATWMNKLTVKIFFNVVVRDIPMFSWNIDLLKIIVKLKYLLIW